MSEETKPTPTYTERVASKIIEALEQGTAPWVKPWSGTELAAMAPMNPVTGNSYKGANFLNLSIEQIAIGSSDPRWLTYKQAASIGAQVREGEKATTIQYWKTTDKIEKTDEEGKPILKDGKPVKETVLLEKPVMLYSSVFNATQIDNMPPLQRDTRPEKAFEAIEAAEAIIANSGAKIRHVEGGAAFYRPSTDEIHLPMQYQFNSQMGYYSTALHELGHWTGHTTRLNRDLSNRFGTEGYSKEELRAEIASYMLASELGVDFDPSNHNSYIKSWVKNLQETPSEIFKAANDAGKIVQFLQGFNTQSQTLTESETTSKKYSNDSVISDMASLKEYIAELKEQFPNFVATTGVSMTNLSLYSNYMMANQDLSEIKYLHLTNDGRQEWENLLPEVAKLRLEVAHFPQIVKEWGLDKINTPQDYHSDPAVLEVKRRTDIYRFDETDLHSRVSSARYNSIQIPLESVENAISRYGTIRLDDTSVKSTTAELVVAGDKYILSTNPKYAVVSPRESWREDIFEALSHSETKLTTLTPTEPQKARTENLFEEKTYLTVPYADKEIAKRNGAKWDKDAKSWFAPEGADRDALSQYIPAPEQSRPDAKTENSAMDWVRDQHSKRPANTDTFSQEVTSPEGESKTRKQR